LREVEGGEGGDIGQMAEQDNYFDVVGVIEDATVEQISIEYRRRALLCHPDRFPGSEEKAAQFVRLRHAYEVLVDPSLRRDYDKYRASGLRVSFEKWKESAARTGATVHWQKKSSEQQRQICDGEVEGVHTASSSSHPTISVPRIATHADHLAWLLDDN